MQGEWFTITPRDAMRRVSFPSRGTQCVGYFHQWMQFDTAVYGIVEKEDGSVLTIRMQHIRFVDEETDDYIWNELSKVYNMEGVPDAAMEIIGNLMLREKGHE